MHIVLKWMPVAALSMAMACGVVESLSPSQIRRDIDRAATVKVTPPVAHSGAASATIVRPTP